MKKALVFVIVCIGLGAGLILAFRQMSQERKTEAAGEAPVQSSSQIGTTAEGNPVVTLDAEAQKRLSLRMAAPTAVTVAPEARAYGRVLDPAPLIAQVLDLAAARAALEASSREWRRLKSLAETQNASARAVEAAEAALTRDRISCEGAQLKLVSAWGRSVAEHPDLPSAAKALANAETALVRLDLPAGERIDAPQGARLSTLAAPEDFIEAEYIGPAVDVDAQAQGAGFLFLVKSVEGRLRPGQALIGRIELAGQPVQGVLVPPAAIVRALGSTWVYVQSGPTTFARRKAPLERPITGGWLVTLGLTAGDRLVVSGAQMLLSEELKSRIQVME